MIKQKQFSKARPIGVAILIGLAALGLAGNVSMASLADRTGTPGSLAAFLLLTSIGLAFSLAALVTVWLALSSDSRKRRSTIFFAGVSVLVVSWLLGYLLNLDPRASLSGNHISNLYLLGFLPVLFLGFSIPLIGTRFFLQRQFARVDSPIRLAIARNPRFSIAAVMMLTTWVAVAGGAIEITRLSMNSNSPETRWVIAGFCFAIAFGFSLIGTMPLIFGLSRERGFWFWLPWSILWVLFIAGVTAATVETINTNGRRYFPSRWTDDSTAMGYLVLVFLLGVVSGLIGIRLLGIRLVKK